MVCGAVRESQADLLKLGDLSPLIRIISTTSEKGLLSAYFQVLVHYHLSLPYLLIALENCQGELNLFCKYPVRSNLLPES